MKPPTLFKILQNTKYYDFLKALRLRFNMQLSTTAIHRINLQNISEQSHVVLTDTEKKIFPNC